MWWHECNFAIIKTLQYLNARELGISHPRLEHREICCDKGERRILLCDITLLDISDSLGRREDTFVYSISFEAEFYLQLVARATLVSQICLYASRLDSATTSAFQRWYTLCRRS